ncbi:hypothetical protein CSE16_13545 [Solibacillus sp. R5-41]|uniref:hypothetical protein n=1 Tax=Solibacillus sp. R5-41 TaxID=2048654 RepID=UPI000C126D69|nr:hypothetical protein [Solibacillus sp. R5-41]ATP40995.1 hypothetical protein CSE16_13545 [Solibacillus sp. R5-41]
MTVALNVKGKDSIIMAIDSRASWKNTPVHNDQCKKIFILPNKVAISFSGSLTRFIFNKDTNEVISRYMDINDLVYGLEHYPNSEKMTINDTIEYVIRKFCSYFTGFTTQIHLGGSEGGKLVFVSMEFKDGEHIKNYPIPLNEYGFRFSGSDHEQIFSNMIKFSGQNPTISNDELAAALIQKSNNELIEFVYNVIAEVIKENVNKSKELQTVGGNIDIVQITKDETVWVRSDGRNM